MLEVPVIVGIALLLWAVYYLCRRDTESLEKEDPVSNRSSTHEYDDSKQANIEVSDDLLFEHCEANSLDLETLEPILRQRPNLGTLKLTNKYGHNVIGRIGPDAHFIITDHCPNLTSLDVSGVSVAPSELISILKKCEKIKKLIIVATQFDDPEELSLIKRRPFIQIQRNADAKTYRMLKYIVDNTKSIEENQLFAELSFYDNWLAEELSSSDQKISEIQWTKTSRGDTGGHIAELKLNEINRSFFSDMDNDSELELSEYDKLGETIWSARALLHKSNRQSSGCIHVIVKNVLKRDKNWYFVEGMPIGGSFKLTNAKLRFWQQKKHNTIRNGLKRISWDYLLRSVILAKGNEFSTLKRWNTLRSVSVGKIKLDDDSGLNESQMNAIKNALCNRISLIMGPPGTGKTFTSASLAFQLFKTRSSSNSKILVCASSNAAVDIIADRIEELGKLKVARISSYYNIKKQKGNCRSFYLNSLLDERLTSDDLSGPFRKYRDLLSRQSVAGRKVNNSKKECEKKILEEIQVICCTCASVPRLIGHGINLFDSIIVDECSQMTVPDGLLLLQFLPRRIVFVGDDNQLGPVIKDNLRKKYNFSNTVLYNKLKGVGFKPVMLNVQYRMHPQIAKFPSQHFYRGKIKNGIEPNDRQWTGERKKCPFPFHNKPIYFHCHTFQEDHLPSSTSCFNLGEIDIVVKTIEVLLSRGLQENDIGVITPYKDQSNYITDRLYSSDSSGEMKKTKSLDDIIEIDTVDAYQGRDKDYIIVSLVRSVIGDYHSFIADPKRLNVTLTRAKYGLIIIGNALNLLNNPFMSALIADCSSRDLLYSEILSEKSRPVTLDELKSGLKC